jgi:hypothetical protein
MKVLWCIMLSALAGLLLAACWPEEKAPICGGVTDRTDHSAPKVIESKQISALSASFWVQDEEGRGARWNLSAKKDSSGGVSVSVEGAVKEEAQAESAFLDAVQEVIERFELAKLNGIDRVTAGLPPAYSPTWLSVDYASGERLYFQMNGRPEAEWPRVLLEIFLGSASR